MNYSPRYRQGFSAFAGYQQAPAYAFHAFSGLGQAAPYQDSIQKIQRSFPPCFTATSIISSIEKAQDFARGMSTEGLSRFGGTTAPASVKRDLDTDWNNLQALKVRFQAEGDKRYCNWLPATARDHAAVLNAIVKPYIDAAAIPGAQAVVAQATDDIKSDLAQGAFTLGGILPDWLNLKVLGAIGLGLLGIYAYRRIKAGREEPEEAPRPRPTPPPRAALSPCPPCPKHDCPEPSCPDCPECPECPTPEYIPPPKPAASPQT